MQVFERAKSVRAFDRAATVIGADIFSVRNIEGNIALYIFCIIPNFKEHVMNSVSRGIISRLDYLLKCKKASNVSTRIQ